MYICLIAVVNILGLCLIKSYNICHYNPFYVIYVILVKEFGCILCNKDWNSMALTVYWEENYIIRIVYEFSIRNINCRCTIYGTVFNQNGNSSFLTSECLYV